MKPANNQNEECLSYPREFYPHKNTHTRSRFIPRIGLIVLKEKLKLICVTLFMLLQKKTRESPRD
jgi:hypothetical protein